MQKSSGMTSSLQMTGDDEREHKGRRWGSHCGTTQSHSTRNDSVYSRVRLPPEEHRDREERLGSLQSAPKTTMAKPTFVLQKGCMDRTLPRYSCPWYPGVPEHMDRRIRRYDPDLGCTVASLTKTV